MDEAVSHGISPLENDLLTAVHLARNKWPGIIGPLSPQADKKIRMRLPPAQLNSHGGALKGAAKSQIALQGSSFQKSSASRVTLSKRDTPSSSLAWRVSGNKPHVGAGVTL